MQAEKFTIPSVFGQELDARVWLPEGKAIGIVQFVHGMAEHIDRYDRPAQALNAAGFIVCGHTHVGHGPKAVIKGHIPDVPGWNGLVEDAHTLRKLMQERFPGLPYFILGHSMGSFVTRCYLQDHGEGLTGAILSGTGYFAPTTLKMGTAIADSYFLFGQSDAPNNFINKIAFGGNNKGFKPAKTGFEWLSRDEAEVAKYVADEYCGFPFTASGYRELFHGLTRLNDLNALKRMPSELPVYFFSGENDPVGSKGKGVEQVVQQFRTAGMKHVDLRLYPEGRHEMFNELNRDAVCEDLIRWLKKHV